MKTLSFINFKGGVAKTVSAVNFAYILAALHDKRVLLIDNDKQGSASKFFGAYDPDAASISDVLTAKDFLIHDAIRRTEYDGLDVIPANMSLLRAVRDILIDVQRPQQTRLSKALRQVADEYDFAIIDNAPDLNMSVINALVASDEVLIPIKVDLWALDGMKDLLDIIEDIRAFNEDIRVAGCFVTMYSRNNVNAQGVDRLKQEADAPFFNTVIRNTVKVQETTFYGKPLHVYSRNSTAARDYEALVAEYLGGVAV